MPQLCLDLDILYQDGYYYTEYDVGGAGHKIYIEPENKELFLDAFAAQWRKRAENLLEEATWLEDNPDDPDYTPF